MGRAIYIGGFGNGNGSAEKVANALGKHYEQVDPFTFAYAYQNQETIARISKGAEAVTHSAGMMALHGVSLEYIHAFNAPLPTNRLRLLGRTGLKTVKMHAGIKDRETLRAVVEFDISSLGEFAAHPLANLRPFIKGEISKFDAVIAASGVASTGTGVTLTYTDSDAYFRLSPEDEGFAQNQGVHVERMVGQHDELALYPVEMLGDYFSNRAP